MLTVNDLRGVRDQAWVDFADGHARLEELESRCLERKDLETFEQWMRQRAKVQFLYSSFQAAHNQFLNASNRRRDRN